MQIDGKVVLITGASEGIGAACAAEFSRAGAKLSLTARSEEGLRRAAGSDGLITAGDLTDENVRRSVVERTVAKYGTIDILINNAGLGFYLPSWSAPMAQTRGLMELNFFALLGMTQLVVPHMRTQRSGMIVNVGSIGGKMTLPWMTIYSASKYAVGSLTEGLRMELRRDNVKTMLVCPGYVKTGFQKNVTAGQAPESMVRARRMAITAAECALAIRKGVARDARTIVTPKPGWILVGLARVFPSIVEARMAAMNETA
ncbi:MAG TPA: SDR family NAD(P)-dependent oxidoreductase [Bryobacteraceae bacterium]|nr:SDR family NAD(P)-dependent oxidoreductase [Bryobacteraceae bacterium]